MRSLPPILAMKFPFPLSAKSLAKEMQVVLPNTFFADAPFIIFDEPTAALDPMAESEIYTKFKPHGVRYPLITIRCMKSRWGSCQPQTGKITLNGNMIAAPREAIEYVILHEFAHFIHPNHSKEFYVLVESMMPDWKQRREMLNGIA